MGGGVALSAAGSEGNWEGSSPRSYHVKAVAGVTSTGYQPKPSIQTSTQAWAARSGMSTVRPGTAWAVKPPAYRAGTPMARSSSVAAEA